MHNMREEDVSHTKKDHWRVTKPKQVKALMHKPRAQLEAISLPGDSHYGEFTLLLSSSISSPASPHTALRSGGPWQAHATTSTRRKRIYASLHSLLLICSCHYHHSLTELLSLFVMHPSNLCSGGSPNVFVVWDGKEIQGDARPTPPTSWQGFSLELLPRHLASMYEHLSSNGRGYCDVLGDVWYI